MLPGVTSIHALHDVDGEGLVAVTRAPVGTLHLTIASEKIAAHTQWELEWNNQRFDLQLFFTLKKPHFQRLEKEKMKG
jgi:hypothetical protein